MLAGIDAPLLARLKAWRLNEAREQGVPAFVIFNDRTLAEIAQRRPGDAAALRDISGIGSAKLAKYGEAVLRLVGV